jgi:YfiH family protein
MITFPPHNRVELRANGDPAVVVSAVDPYDAVMAFSLRVGGCSPPPFETLNFSVQHGDAPENVNRNFELLGSHLSIDAGRIATCRQVHGDDVLLLDDVPGATPSADAMITSVPNLYVGVKTADCVPILLIDPIRRVSAAVHAGWRGTVKRITRKTVQLMKEMYHCREENIVAALGPAIRGCCYEVDDAVLVPFSQNVPDSERFIATVRKNGSPRDAHMLDLVATNREELTREGIPPKSIHDVNLCTSCTPELLFSYRRDGAASGRHISLAGFRS